MKSFRSPFSGAKGFTLLEVMLSVLILGLISVGMFKFVQGNLRAIQISMEDAEEVLSVERVVALIQEELYAIPSRGSNNRISGIDQKYESKDMDTLEWNSRGGPGLMTTAATGEYRVTLRMKPITATSREYEIGLTRRPVLLDSAGGLVQGGSDKDATWVPLLSKTTGLRVRYWDPRLGQLITKWNDPSAVPTFIVLSILKEGETVPYEAVLTVPASMTQQ